MLGLSPLITYIFMGIGIAINVFFCRSLIKTLTLIKEDNQKIHPFLIWLLLIPIVNTAWIFYVVIRMAESLKKELEDRDFETTNYPTLLIGMAYALLSLMLGLIADPKDLQSNSPALGVLGIAILIAFVQYWMKINWYKKVLEKDAVGDYSNEQL